jgi:hypothetical protein
MIILLALTARSGLPPQAILDWFGLVRQAAIEVPGVYDLALYRNVNTPTLWSALDVEDDRSSTAFWQDRQVQKALQMGHQLGLDLAVHASWQRLV